MNNIDLSQLITAQTKLAKARADRMAALAELRWRSETGGLELPDGSTILTTRESQAQLSSAMQMIQAGMMTGPIDWKFASGWHQLSAEQLVSLATAVLEHVRDCFAAEKIVAAQMDATPGDLSDFDILAAFEAARTVPTS